MYRETLRQHIESLVEPLLTQQGFELVEVQVRQQKGRSLIRLYADSAVGISLEDCQRLSFEIGQVLDAEDVMPGTYVLEVSSPGLDRPLRTLRDFQRQCNRLVTVFLRAPLMGTLQYTGRVVTVGPDDLVLHLSPDTPCSIPLLQIDYGIVELEFK